MSRGDLRIVAELGGLWTLAQLLPERHWAGVCRRLAHLYLRLRRHDAQLCENRIERGLRGTAVSSTPRNVLIELVGHGFQRLIHVMQEHSSHGWRPTVRLVGREHIENAVQGGRGVILWVYPFVYSALIAKRAIRQAGFAPAHLSRAGHPFSGTRFGVRFLNPIQVMVENRYLFERIVITPGAEVSALRKLQRRLREGRVIMVTANTEGRGIIEVPFLSGRLRLARGAPVLARTEGAALLPLFSTRESTGDFVVTVEAAVNESGGNGNDLTDYQLVHRYARCLESHVVRYPSQWPEWRLRDHWACEAGVIASARP